MTALPEIKTDAIAFPHYSAWLTLDATLFFGSVNEIYGT